MGFDLSKGFFPGGLQSCREGNDLTMMAHPGKIFDRSLETVAGPTVKENKTFEERGSYGTGKATLQPGSFRH